MGCWNLSYAFCVVLTSQYRNAKGLPLQAHLNSLGRAVDYLTSDLDERAIAHNILDLVLADYDGKDIIKSLRRGHRMPIIVLSARLGRHRNGPGAQSGRR